jgi:hypothetical protein
MFSSARALLLLLLLLEVVCGFVAAAGVEANVSLSFIDEDEDEFADNAVVTIVTASYGPGGRYLTRMSEEQMALRRQRKV